METNREDIWGSFGQNKLHALEVYTIDPSVFGGPGSSFFIIPAPSPFGLSYCLPLPHFSIVSCKLARLPHGYKTKRTILFKCLQRDFRYLSGYVAFTGEIFPEAVLLSLNICLTATRWEEPCSLVPGNI